MSKITIIVPIYNCKNKIKKCIDSLLKQSFKDYEVLLINDGSTDNTYNIINKYLKEINDKRYILFDKKNEGCGTTRNYGIKNASGDYICFIDNDDYIDTDYLFNLYSNLEINTDVILSGFKRVDEKGKILYSEKVPNTNWGKYTIITPWAKLFKRSFLLENDIEFFNYGIGEDIYFNLLLYSKKPNIKIIPYYGYNWLYNKVSVSNTLHKGLNKNIDFLFLLQKIRKIYNNEEDECVIYFYKKSIVWYLLYSGKNSNSKEFVMENDRLFKWLKNCKFSKNISPFSNKIKGEKLKNKLFVFCYCFLNKIGLIKMFSKIYCRGDRNA